LKYHSSFCLASPLVSSCTLRACMELFYAMNLTSLLHSLKVLRYYAPVHFPFCSLSSFFLPFSFLPS
jgi:hypothetical protein